MRYLWISTSVILIAGAVLTVGGLIGALEAIAPVLGLLLLWTGIVKIVVLRIWQRRLSQPPPALVVNQPDTRPLP